MNTDNVKLTPRQKAFVTEYVTCRNGAEAARKAKYSKKTARQMAAENLTKPVIQVAIAAKEAEIAEKLDLDRNAVIGGIFSGIAHARDSNDAGGIIRGWLAVSRVCGLGKSEAATDHVLSASKLVLEARFAEMTDAELMDIATGRAA